MSIKSDIDDGKLFGSVVDTSPDPKYDHAHFRVKIDGAVLENLTMVLGDFRNEVSLTMEISKAKTRYDGESWQKCVASSSLS